MVPFRTILGALVSSSNFHKTNITKSLTLLTNSTSYSVIQKRSLHTTEGPNEILYLEAYDQTHSTENTKQGSYKRLSVKATQVDTGETTIFSTKAQAARSLGLTKKAVEWRCKNGKPFEINGISLVLSYESKFPTTLTPSSGGNYHSGSRLGAMERAKIKVTPEQHEVIIGSLLGDMYAARPTPKRNCRLSIYQSNQSYLLSLAASLSTLVRQSQLTIHNKLDRKTGTLFYGHEFSTMSLLCLNVYRELFYPEGVKIIPNDISQHLTARGLAHWFMQDGYKHGNSAKFATNCFNDQNIYVRCESISRFVELVKPCMHSSMLYKLPSK